MNRVAMSQFEAEAAESRVVQQCGALRAMGKNIVSTIAAPPVWIPLLLLMAATALFRCTDADMALERQFFVNSGPGSPWPLMEVAPWRALYDWGVYPAWILGCGGLLIWLASFRWLKLERWRDAGLFYCLLLILGPGVLINGVLKPCWGRPRPCDIVEFGGDCEFLPVCDWGHGQDVTSFPCGHASMGFYLMAPAFVCYRRRRGLAWAFLLLGLASGGLIGLARVVAGGHFPSDVIWAGGLIYFTGLAIAAPFKFGDDKPPFWKHGR
jgi:lipid A 4'-phosphatase